MAVKTGLATSQGRADRCPGGGITTDGQLLGDEITVGQGQTKKSKKNSEIVSDVVEILLGVNELIEGGDTIVSQEVVVGSSVQTRARAANVVGARLDECVGSVTWSWDLETSQTLTLATVDSRVVWVLWVVRGSRDVVGVEGAASWSTWVGATRLLALVGSGLASEERRVDARHFRDEGEGRSRGGEEREVDCVLHLEDVNEFVVMVKIVCR